MRPVFRTDPLLPNSAMQTYGFVRPEGSHDRAASCAEVQCAARERGWETKVDVSTELGVRQANYIRLRSGRAFRHAVTGDIVTFNFPAGQECFAGHRIPLDRPPIYYKHGGDWRGATSSPVEMKVADWIDDFANHQNMVADKKQEG